MTSLRWILVVSFSFFSLAPLAGASNGLNDLLGIQLWGGGSLWDDVAADTAARLKLFDHSNQNQNQNGNKGHFRANLEKSKGLKILGARVYSIEIYSLNRKVSRIVIGFVNRADLMEELSDAVDPQKAPLSYGQFMVRFETALAKERESAYAGICAQLNRRLGPQIEGTASTIRQWIWKNHLLTVENADLALTLRFEPYSQVARSTGTPSERLKTQKLRSRSNGDVVLSGILPISQGPRGFCVPASWEKCLRYYGLNLDVYQLGEKGGTDFNGTLFIPFAAKMVPLLEPQQFRMQLLKPEALGLEMVKAYIDQAAPLIWAMDARELRYWVDRSKKRSSYLTDEAEGLRKDPRSMLGPSAGHALLIVGYNSALKEVALSDSTELGSGEGEIWIREKDLLAAAMPDGLVAVLPDDSKLLGETKFLNPSMLRKKTILRLRDRAIKNGIEAEPDFAARVRFFSGESTRPEGNQFPNVWHKPGKRGCRSCRKDNRKLPVKVLLF